MADGTTQALHDHKSFRPPAPAPLDRPLGLFALLAALRRNPLECWTKQHFEEPVVEARLPFGRALLVSDPGAIRRLLLENTINYRKDRLQRAVLSAGMGEGLLTAEGEAWRNLRRIAAPVFALRAVRECAPSMAGAVHARMANWQDGPLDIDVEMRRLTLEVLERTVFADGFGRDAEDIRLAMASYFPAIGRIGLLDLLGAPDFVPRARQKAARPALRLLEEAIDDLVAARREELDERCETSPDDILTRLLAAADAENGARLSVAEVRSNILILFAAGHETTANALTWSIFLLANAPTWRERLSREAWRVFGRPPGAAVDELTETRAVLEEALRLYPPIAAVSRVAVGADELAGTAVRRGDIVVVSPWVLHRHRALWSAPDVFDPLRFLGKARAAVDRFAYLPFGAGPRTCVGAEFAMQEATLALSQFVRDFAFDLEPGADVRPLLEVTLKPAGGLRMRVQRLAPSRRRAAAG